MVMTTSVYVCLKSVVILFVNLLELIFKQALTTNVFPSELKKGSFAPCYKKGDTQNLKNYRPVSLLPICRKFFEKLIFNKMFSFFWLTIS